MLADVIDHIEYKFGIRTDGLTMSIYSSIMVAATPVCNSIFSAILNASGYDQAADIALGTAAQTAAAQTAISVGYIWVCDLCNSDFLLYDREGSAGRTEGNCSKKKQ